MEKFYFMCFMRQRNTSLFPLFQRKPSMKIIWRPALTLPWKRNNREREALGTRLVSTCHFSVDSANKIVFIIPIIIIFVTVFLWQKLKLNSGVSRRTHSIFSENVIHFHELFLRLCEPLFPSSFAIWVAA